jgi:signal transduction histidine kinase
VRSLRGRLSLGVGLIVALVLGVAGVLISDYAERVARDNVDDRLRRTVELSRATAVEAVANSLPDADRRLDAVLRATRSSLRLVVGKAVVLEAGLPLLKGDTPASGLRTVEREGEPIRVLVSPLRGAGLGDLARLEVASSLDDVDRRQRALDRRLALFGALALVVTVLGTSLAVGRLTAPLRRLRPTRRFALDAGHELRTPLTTVQATLSALHRHPDVPAEQRTEMLGDALDEQKRLVTLLDGLQALARGDAVLSDPEPVDLADVVAVATAEARGRHPGAEIDVTLPEEPVVVRGWEPGLRMLVGNLVVNAAHHGRGHVAVALTGGAAPVLTVDDDGPGIPEGDRERIFEPFERLDESAGRSGSGLGLALVAQQAREHGASVSVGDSPLGGARFRVAFS